METRPRKEPAQVTFQGPRLLIQPFPLRPWKPRPMPPGLLPRSVSTGPPVQRFKIPQIHPHLSMPLPHHSDPVLAPPSPPAPAATISILHARARRILLNCKPDHVGPLLRVPRSLRDQVRTPQHALRGLEHAVPAMSCLSTKVEDNPVTSCL